MSIKKVKGGFENVSKSGKTFSKKPLSRKKTLSQLKAIEWSKHKGK